MIGTVNIEYEGLTQSDVLEVRYTLTETQGSSEYCGSVQSHIETELDIDRITGVDLDGVSADVIIDIEELVKLEIE